MDWEQRLVPYEGRLISIWIEDQSGEEQTKPKSYTLSKVEKSSGEETLKLYISPTQFLYVPLFGEELTKLDMTDVEDHFVSHDAEAKLVYRVCLSKV
jgi:hypothetical protein